MVPRLTNAKSQRGEIVRITGRTGLTLGVLVNVGRVMRGLVLGAVLRGRLVVVVLLVGHIRKRELEATRARREGERGRWDLL